MKIATTTYDFKEYSTDIQEVIVLLKKSGFQNIDYNFGSDYANKKGSFLDDWKNYIDKIKKVAEENKINFVQAHAPMGRPLSRNGEGEKIISATKRCIECCAELGIKNLIVHSGYEQNCSKEETFERNRLFYKELLDFAAPFNVNILTENFNKMCFDDVYWIDNAKDLRALIDHVDHPLFHACWDTGHGNMLDISQTESLQTLGKHVYALHVQDNRGDDDHHVAPYFGTLNLDDLMNGLLSIGYNGYFTFESDAMLYATDKRRMFNGINKLRRAPLPIKIKAENLLYEIGKYTLETYSCFEE